MMKTTTLTYFNHLDIDPQQSMMLLLQDICEKHLANFSFNNINILLKPQEILSLRIEDLIEKIVTQGRGGYCFEHNKLLFDVLQDLGAQVRPQLARVVYGREGDFPRSHRVTLIEVDGAPYLIDVGFGPYSPLGIIPLSGRETVCLNGARYRVTESLRHQYQLEIWKEGAFFTLYSFDLGAYSESDFEVANFYTNFHPGSKFVKELVLSRIRPAETTFIALGLFSHVSASGRTDQTIESASALREIGESCFDLSLTDADYEILFSKIQAPVTG